MGLKDYSVLFITQNEDYTANIFNVIFTLFTGIPLSTVISLYILHLIIAPSTVEKCEHWFTVVYCNFYIGMCMANTCNLHTFLRVSQFPYLQFMCTANMGHILEMYIVQWNNCNKVYSF
jgi:hypothetical protein